MTIDRLLGKLIDISGSSKTNFALAINMTPSGLSKILSKNTNPTIKNRRVF